MADTITITDASDIKEAKKRKHPKQRKRRDLICSFNTSAPLSVQVIAPRATKVVIKVTKRSQSVDAPLNPLSDSDIYTVWGQKPLVRIVDGFHEPFRYGIPHGHRGVRAGSEDGWRGFGYLGCDCGRYGGISSEDYLD